MSKKKEFVSEEQVISFANRYRDAILQFKTMKRFKTLKDYRNYILKQKKGKAYVFGDFHYQYLKCDEFGNYSNFEIKTYIDNVWEKYSKVSLEEYELSLFKNSVSTDSISKRFNLSKITEEEIEKKKKSRNVIKKLCKKFKDSVKYNSILEYGANYLYVLGLTMIFAGLKMHGNNIVISGDDLIEFCIRLGFWSAAVEIIAFTIFGLISNPIYNYMNKRDNKKNLDNLLDMIRKCKDNTNINEQDERALNTLEIRISKLRKMYEKEKINNTVGKEVTVGRTR